jgi:membrane associated rhomboid family serine protease
MLCYAMHAINLRSAKASQFYRSTKLAESPLRTFLLRAKLYPHVARKEQASGALTCDREATSTLLIECARSSRSNPLQGSFLVTMPLRINLPPLTRALLLLLLLLSLLNASFSVRSLIRVQAVPALAIIPARSLKYPWTMLTAALVETNLVSFAISAITIFYGGRYLERAWTSQEFAKFVLFVTMIPNLLTFAIYCLWYTVTGSQIRA